MTLKYYGLLLGSALLTHLAAGQALPLASPVDVSLRVPTGGQFVVPGSLPLWAPDAGQLLAAIAPELDADTTRYYPATSENQVESTIDSAGICTELLRTGPHQGLGRSFYPSGRLRTYVPYADCASGMRHGHVSTWYESGQLQALEPYVQGRRQGRMLLYYEDGRLKRESEYEAGRELPGLCYDPAGQPVAYFPYEQLPLYPGGDEQLLRELSRVLRRVSTPGTLAHLIASYVQVSFLVSTEGRVEELQLEAASLLPAYDQALLAAINRLSRSWVPGLRDGQRTAYAFRLQVPVGATVVPSALQRL